MCGICGYVGVRDDDALLERMAEALTHRGPDSAGYFRSDDVGLGHRRLSIIDVAGGQQPIENEDGSLILICNGEVYNYQELREELLAQGHRFRTRSDSEVILHLYEDLGPACLQRMVGMWAIAIYDTRKRELFLARDRLGIKPLYYVERPGRFLFASEVKSILRDPTLQPTLDPQAIHAYLALRYVPGPGGMFRELRKLPAGHYAILRDGQLTLQPYWQPEIFAGPFPRRDEDYIEEFGERFERSIRRRMISEVPVGAYLSAGLDSSTIVAAMAQLTAKPVRTFTVGFDYQHDELAEAAATARHLGCEHTEISCRPSDVELLPRIVYHLDEPIGDPIVIPMFQLARRAKQDVTVVLTGEGADETLGGYLFHRALLAGGRLAGIVPRPVRDYVLKPLIAMTPAALINVAFDYPADLGRRGKRKVLDFLDLLEPAQLPQAYHHLISLFDARDTVGLYTESFARSLPGAPAGNGTQPLPAHVPLLNRILALQFAHWLPEDILMKQDKMSMASAIEARVPFLDHELVELTLRLPPHLKLRRGTSKYVLRRYAQRLLPRPTTARRKMPFYMPIEQHLRDPVFQAMLSDTLSDRAVRTRGILEPAAVARLRDSLHRQEFLFVKQAFSLMALELWFRTAVDRRGHP